MRCGCGESAEWAVYEFKQPHCFECMKDAASVDDVIVKYVPDWRVELNGQVSKCNK